MRPEEYDEIRGTVTAALQDYATMNAHEQLRKQINAIHSDLNMRGIHSKAIEDATYAIETMTLAYMSDAPAYMWHDVKLTPMQRTIVDLLYRHLGHTVHRDLVLDASFPDGRDQYLSTPRKNLDVHICNIRRRIAKTPFEIKTVCGQGFAMVHKPSALALTALQELQAH